MNEMIIGVESYMACTLGLTGISDADALFSRTERGFQIRYPENRRFALVSFVCSEDAIVNVCLQANLSQGDTERAIEIRRIGINGDDLQEKQILGNGGVIVISCFARKKETIHMAVNWKTLFESRKIEANHITRSDKAVVVETDAAKGERLRRWKRKKLELSSKGEFLDPLRYIVNEEKKLVYCENCKVACSSIESVMIDEPFSEYTKVHEEMDKRREQYLKTGRMNKRGMSLTRISEGQKEYYTFTFVRNPFERIVSCYESKYHTDRDLYGVLTLDFEYYLWAFLKYDEGFEPFVRKVCEIPYVLMDRHIRPQHYSAFDKNGTKICDYIGKLENIEEDFEKIRERFGLDRLPHLNRSYSQNWMDYYSIETAEMVYEKYKKDFTVFGYQGEYSKLIQYLKKV